MKLNVNKETITIENKIYNLDAIDFILYNGKIRLYKNDGTIESVCGSFTAEQRQLCFLDVAYAISSINGNFLRLDNKTLLNLNNVKNLNETTNGIILITKNFELQLNNLDEGTLYKINDKIADNKLMSDAILL